MCVCVKCIEVHNNLDGRSVTRAKGGLLKLFTQVTVFMFVCVSSA